MTFLICLFVFIVGFVLGLKYKSSLISFLHKLKKTKSDINSENTTKQSEDLTQEEEEEEDFEDADLKMVFLVRDDLKLGAGKIAAQVAHAAVGLVEKITEKGKPYYKKAYSHWSEFGAKKIVLKAKDLDELKSVSKLCKNLKIPCTMISDAGHTQVDPGTITVLGIGPEASDRLNKITGKFRLMK